MKPQVWVQSKPSHPHSPPHMLREVCFITQERRVFRETEEKAHFHIWRESQSRGGPQEAPEAVFRGSGATGPWGGEPEKLLSEFAGGWAGLTSEPYGARHSPSLWGSPAKISFPFHSQGDRGPRGLQQAHSRNRTGTQASASSRGGEAVLRGWREGTEGAEVEA